MPYWFKIKGIGAKWKHGAHEVEVSQLVIVTKTFNLTDLKFCELLVIVIILEF